MKKTTKALLAVAAMASVALGGCDGYNKQFFDFNYKFTKVHVLDAGKCFEIESWTDFEDGDQIQVKIKGSGTCVFHSNSIILVEDKCPLCGK